MYYIFVHGPSLCLALGEWVAAVKQTKVPGTWSLDASFDLGEVGDKLEKFVKH
jgi:hypothetical protein